MKKITVLIVFLFIQIKIFAQTDSIYGQKDSLCIAESIDEVKKIKNCDIFLAFGANDNQNSLVVPQKIKEIDNVVHLIINCHAEIILPTEIQYLKRLRVVELHGVISEKSIIKELISLDSLSQLYLYPDNELRSLPKVLFHNHLDFLDIAFSNTSFIGKKLIRHIRRIIKKSSLKTFHIFEFKGTEVQKKRLRRQAAAHNIHLVFIK